MRGRSLRGAGEGWTRSPGAGRLWVRTPARRKQTKQMQPTRSARTAPPAELWDGGLARFRAVPRSSSATCGHRTLHIWLVWPRSTICHRFTFVIFKWPHVTGGCRTGKHESRQLVSQALVSSSVSRRQRQPPPRRAAMERERGGLREHWHVTGDAETSAPANGGALKSGSGWSQAKQRDGNENRAENGRRF